MAPNILFLTSFSILKFPYTQTTLQSCSNYLIFIDLFYSNNHLGHFIVLRSWFLFILFLIIHIGSRSLISKCSIWNNKLLRVNNSYFNDFPPSLFHNFNVPSLDAVINLYSSFSQSTSMILIVCSASNLMSSSSVPS